MNPTLGHYLVESAKQYFDYRAIVDLSGFSNKNVDLYRYTDPKYGLHAFGSSYAQWCYHSGLGANIASGVNDHSFHPKSSSLFADYANGRFLSSGNIPGSLSSQVSVSDINTYITTKSDSQIVGETNFLSRPDLKTPTGYLPPYSNVLSAAYFRVQGTENEPLAIGGTDWTAYKLRIICVMKNNDHLMAVGDMIRDMKNRTFPLIRNGYSWPFTEYGDIKTGYDYNSYLTSPQAVAFIDRVNFAYLQNDVFAAKNPSFEVGIGTLDIRVPRNPHSN